MPAAVELAKFYDFIKKPINEDKTVIERELGAATRVAERKVGPILMQDFTSRVRATGDALALPKTPIVSVDSATGVFPPVLTWATADLVVESALAGILRPLYMPFTNGQVYDVAYRAGWAASLDEVPENYAEAVCIIGKHLVEVRYGHAARPGLLGDTAANQDAERRLPTGFAIPARARELLAEMPTVA